MLPELSRREMIVKTGALAAAGAFLGGCAVTRPAVLPPKIRDAASRKPAGDRIRLGFIGTGGMGRGLLGNFMLHNDIDVVALADVYDKHAHEAAEQAGEKGHKPKLYRDFRRVIDHPDIDAVVIATPDHWHAIPTIFACHAGKDVYVEKPLSHNVIEGRAMINAARRFNRVTQLGTLIHSSDIYRQVADIVQSGMLGDISRIRLGISGNRTPDGIGRPADGEPPTDCDYDMWLGPAPKRPFNPLRFTFNWRYFWDYGGGGLADFICHLVDLVYWSLDLKAPKAVTAGGGRYILNDIAETPDTLDVLWEFTPQGRCKKPFQLIWSHNDANGRRIEGGDWAIAFYGSNATLLAHYGAYEIIPEKYRKVEGIKLAESAGFSECGKRHSREFLDGIKSRQRCSCDIEYGHQMTKLAHIAHIALRTGRKLTWDDENERFINATEANRLLGREYRAPWVLPT